MKFCCASNAAFKNVEIARKKINFFPKKVFKKSLFFQNLPISRKTKIYFRIPDVLPVILTTYLPV